MSVMLEQMRVLITAGASGIGATIARTFAADGALVDVADIDGTAVETLTSSDEHIRGRICDVSDPQAVDGWIDAALSRWHGVDVLVNNAGIAGPTNYVEDIEVEQWRRCVAITLESQFLTCRRGGLRSAHSVCIGEMGSDRPDQVAGNRTGGIRGARQCDLPRVG
jgi:NAD(P)-dependent dehydrogenase (short-subunit alcohol dehydrogenase family)